MAAATRTQVYFSAEQRRRLDERSRREGKSLAEVVREAVDAYLAEEATDIDTVLEATFGTAPHFEVPSRSEWDHRPTPD